MGDLGRRHRAGPREQERQLRLRDRHGHPALRAVRRRQELDPVPGATSTSAAAAAPARTSPSPGTRAGSCPSTLSHTLMTGASSKTAQRVTPDVVDERRPLHLGAGRHVRRRARTARAATAAPASPPRSSPRSRPTRSRPGTARRSASPTRRSTSARPAASPSTTSSTRPLSTSQPPLSSVADFGVINGTLAVRLVAFGRGHRSQRHQGLRQRHRRRLAHRAAT